MTNIKMKLELEKISKTTWNHNRNERTSAGYIPPPVTSKLTETVAASKDAREGSSSGMRAAQMKTEEEKHL